MLKLIIADDERVIRETISRLIDWESIGVEVVGLCKNGIEAYNMILDESPDIVMTDIRMPGLTGLELVREISQSDQRIQFIILSGYEDFEYAREAMKYGIRHYLLKPCNEEKIKESILKAGEDCREARRRLVEKEKQSLMTKTIRQDIVYHLLMDGISLKHEKDDGLKKRLAELEEFYGQYADFYQHPCRLYYVYFLEQQYLEKLLGRLRQNEDKSQKQNIFYGVYVKNTLLLFCYEALDTGVLKAECGEASDSVTVEESAYSTLLELLEAVLVRIRRYDTIYAIHNFKPISILNNQNILPHIQNIYLQLEKSKGDDVRKLCAELRLMAEGATQTDFLKMLGSSICIHLPTIVACSSVEVAELMKEINQSEEIEQLRTLTGGIISRIENELCLTSQEYGVLVDKVMAYVEEHLSDKNLTLKKIAEQHLYMNVDYVSRQFRRITGIKFSQYLSDQRVKRAKELLMDAGTGKIQYVAEQVGCGNNPQYFSQIFKKSVGVTPGKWASQMQNK